MNAVWFVVAAVLCNAAAQMAIKAGAGQGALSPYLAAGLALYAVSFVLTVRIYAAFPLSVISPLMAGAIFLVVSVCAMVFFAEPITWAKAAGAALVVAGIALLARSA